MLRGIGIAAIAAVMAFCLGAAIGAETMPFVPIQQRLGLARDCGLARGQHKGGSPHFLKSAFAQCGLVFTRQIHREQRLFAIQPQKHASRAVPFPAPMLKFHARVGNERPVLPEGKIVARSGLPCQPRGIAAPFAGAVQGIAGKSDRGHLCSRIA